MPSRSILQSIAALLFPDPPRDFPGRRGIKIVLRAVHVLFVGVYVGAFVFDVAPVDRQAWFLGTLISGLCLLAFDLHESGAFLLQVRGVFVLAKLALLAALPWLVGYEAVVLGALVLLSVISSHAPSKVRYFLVLGRGKVEPSQKKG